MNHYLPPRGLFANVRNFRDVIYGYTGRRFDGETGMWFFRARYFDSELGRFISRDPLTYIDGYSMYRGYFVPNGLDPSGMEVTEVITIGGREYKYDPNTREARVRVDYTSGPKRGSTEWRRLPQTDTGMRAKVERRYNRLRDIEMSNRSVQPNLNSSRRRSRRRAVSRLLSGLWDTAELLDDVAEMLSSNSSCGQYIRITLENLASCDYCKISIFTHNSQNFHANKCWQETLSFSSSSVAVINAQTSIERFSRNVRRRCIDECAGTPAIPVTDN